MCNKNGFPLVLSYVMESVVGLRALEENKEVF